ncbi:MAG: PH domain-containing protein, partial [Nocardioidaceae bacterium]
MAIMPKQLMEGEHVIVSTRTHWKALVAPAIVLIVVCAVGGFVIGLLPDTGHTPLLVIVLIVWVALLIWFSLRPFLRWLSASFTVTNRRLINRSGVITRRGQDIPLQRINDVRYERGILDRILGCGTLIVSDASEQGRSVLNDVPHVE